MKRFPIGLFLMMVLALFGVLLGLMLVFDSWGIDLDWAYPAIYLLSFWALFDSVDYYNSGKCKFFTSARDSVLIIMSVLVAFAIINFEELTGIEVNKILVSVLGLGVGVGGLYLFGSDGLKKRGKNNSVGED